MNQQPRDQRSAGQEPAAWQPAGAQPGLWPAAPPGPGGSGPGAAPVHRAMQDRERGRVRLRAVTVTAGLAGLVAAGVIAANLPGSAHTSTGKRASSGSSGPVSRSSSGNGNGAIPGVNDTGEGLGLRRMRSSAIPMSVSRRA